MAVETFGIDITATDKTGPAFKSAAAGAKKTTKSIGGLAKENTALPGNLGKSVGALNLMSGAIGNTGSAAVDGAMKLTDLALVAGTGGPVGIAIAAATIAIGAVMFAVKKFGEEAEYSKKKVKEFGDATKAMGDQAKSISDRIFALDANLYGVSGAEQKLILMQRQIKLAKRLYGKTLAEYELLKFGEFYNQEIIDAKLAQVNATVRNLDLLEEEKRAQEALIFQSNEKEAAQERAIARQKRLNRLKEKEAELATFEKEIATAAGKWEDEQEAKKRKWEEWKEAQSIKLHKELMSRLKEEGRERAERRKIIADAEAKEDEAKRARAKEIHDAQMQMNQIMASSIASATNEMVIGMIEGRDDMQAVFTDMLKSMAKQMISAAITRIITNAFVGGAGATASSAEMGPAGLIAAPAVGLAMVATIMKFKNDLPKARQGALVRGGMVGVDSVPILAQQGEMVLPKQLTDMLLRMAQGGNGSISNNNSQTIIYNQMFPASRQQNIANATTFSRHLAAANRVNGVQLA